MPQVGEGRATRLSRIMLTLGRCTKATLYCYAICAFSSSVDRSLGSDAPILADCQPIASNGLNISGPPWY